MPRNDFKLSKVPEGGVSIGMPLSPVWRGWFEDLYNMVGSQNNFGLDTWTPQITGLTGSATITDAHYIKFRKTIHFSLSLNPIGATSSTSGTTYISALPRQSIACGECHVFNITSRAIIGHGFIDKNSDKIYLPSWSSISDNLSISGFVFVDG